MKLFRIYILFFSLSALLIVLAVMQSQKVGFFKPEPVKVKKIQKLCKKKYLRSRKVVIATKSLPIAEQAIASCLLKSPIKFNINSSALEMNSSDEMQVNSRKVVLTKVVKILNHLEEAAILSIETHTDAQGSQQHNLLLSQERANVLKSYFREKCSSLPLIVAIGYGEEMPLPKKSKRSNRRVEMHLNRIQ